MPGFNVCIYCDVAEEGLYVCQLFNKVCVCKSLIKTICENRRKKYIVAIAKSLAKCQRWENNWMNNAAQLNSQFQVGEILLSYKSNFPI